MVLERNMSLCTKHATRRTDGTCRACSSGIAVVNEVLYMWQLSSDVIEYVTFQPGSTVVVITFTNTSSVPAAVIANNVTQVSTQLIVSVVHVRVCVLGV